MAADDPADPHKPTAAGCAAFRCRPAVTPNGSGAWPGPWLVDARPESPHQVARAGYQMGPVAASDLPNRQDSCAASLMVVRTRR